MKLLISLVIALLPFIMFTQLIQRFDMGLNSACLISVGILVITGYKSLKKGFIISWVGLLCLILILALNQIIEQKYLKDPWLLTNLSLAIASFVSLALRKPFTMQHARETVAKEKWDHPVFLQINTVLTLVWGIIFLLSFSLRVYLLIYNDIAESTVVFTVYVLTFFGILFTMNYPKWARNKSKQETRLKEVSMNREPS